MLQIQNLKAGFPCLQGRTAQVERSFRPTLRGSLHPLSTVAFFSLIFRSAPAKQNQKQRRPKTRNRKKPKEVDEHYFGPKPTGTQTRNQTKPTDRPTEPSTGPGPGADTKLYH
jgi:hypothetical protein